MSEQKWPYRLLAPGPVPVPPLVMRRMSEKVIHHRTPEFEKTLLDAWAGLQMVFCTRQPVQILCGTGSSAMEAAMVNLLSPGDEVLVVVSGKFGERWAEMAERFGCRVDRLNVPWGEPVGLDEFRARLKPTLKAVFTQACETSTATMHPIREMAALVRAVGALFCVDAITAVGCVELPMDEWELDVVVAGSQKAFMIPTGLSFIALSERAWAAVKTSRLPKFYLDLEGERRANAKKETHFSTPTPLVIGLAAVLDRVREVGLLAVQQRCALLAAVTRDTLGVPVFSKAPSNSVTALTVADSGSVRDWLERERNITVMGGQDQLKGKILRIGHMGDVRDEDMLAFFMALGEKLALPFDGEKLLARLRTVAPLFPSN